MSSDEPIRPLRRVGPLALVAGLSLGAGLLAPPALARVGDLVTDGGIDGVTADDVAADGAGAEPSAEPETMTPDAGSDPDVDAAAAAVAELREAPTPEDEAAAPGSERCDALLIELERREEQDLIDWEAIENEFEGEELTEEQLEQVDSEVTPVDGEVLGRSDRASFEAFGSEPALDELGDLELVLAVEYCFESGQLVDPEDEGDLGPDNEDQGDEPDDESTDDEGADDGGTDEDPDADDEAE